MSIISIIGCSTLGFYCRACHVSLNKESLQPHLKRNHAEILQAILPKQKREQLKWLEDNRTPIAFTGPPEKGFVCSSCQQIIKIRRNVLRHANQKCPGATLDNVVLQKTTCFRDHVVDSNQATSRIVMTTVPVATTATMPTTARTPTTVHATVTATTAATASPAMAARPETTKTTDANAKSFTTQQQQKDRAEKDITKKQALAAIRPFVPFDENPEVWANIFQRVIRCGDLETTMRRLISYWADDVKDEEPHLSSLLSLGDLFFDEFADLAISSLQGNVRNRLVTFEVLRQNPQKSNWEK